MRCIYIGSILNLSVYSPSLKKCVTFLQCVTYCWHFSFNFTCIDCDPSLYGSSVVLLNVTPHKIFYCTAKRFHTQQKMSWCSDITHVAPLTTPRNTKYCSILYVLRKLLPLKLYKHLKKSLGWWKTSSTTAMNG